MGQLCGHWPAIGLALALTAVAGCQTRKPPPAPPAPPEPKVIGLAEQQEIDGLANGADGARQP